MFNSICMLFKSKEVRQNKIISDAMVILFSRLSNKSGDEIVDTNSAHKYLMLHLLGEKREVFSCLFLDNKNRLIEYKELFYGTVNGCSVYPREVVRYCIETNAAAVIFAHNHPSGSSEPSQSDKLITQQLKETLTNIDVRVLDHYIIGDEVTSFMERGLL